VCVVDAPGVLLLEDVVVALLEEILLVRINGFVEPTA